MNTLYKLKQSMWNGYLFFVLFNIHGQIMGIVDITTANASDYLLI